MKLSVTGGFPAQVRESHNCLEYNALTDIIVKEKVNYSEIGIYVLQAL